MKEIIFDAEYTEKVLLNLDAEETGYVFLAIVEKILTGHEPIFDDFCDAYGDPLNKRLMLTAYKLLFDSLTIHRDEVVEGVTVTASE